jgi:predicted AAA+ superfamily ATPase
MIDWTDTLAAVWRPQKGTLKAIRHLDSITLGDLLGIDRQKALVLENTERFLRREPANNVLLWGARGTGKSSLIKALLNHCGKDGLRVIQIDKDDLLHLLDIVDDIRERSERFIVFCDDLSFEDGERSYKALKSVLEGSIEAPPENVLIYATSNRRHLVPESMRDNVNSKVHETEIHYQDGIEERISLSDRFGLWLSFYPINQEQYLAMVDRLFGDVSDPAALHGAAIRFATAKGGRSGRTARQFFHHASGKF